MKLSNVHDFFRKHINKLKSLKVNPKKKELDELRKIYNSFNFNVKNMSHKEMICLMQLRDMIYCYTRQSHALFELTFAELKREYRL